MSPCEHDYPKAECSEAMREIVKHETGEIKLQLDKIQGTLSEMSKVMIAQSHDFANLLELSRQHDVVFYGADRASGLVRWSRDVDAKIGSLDQKVAVNSSEISEIRRHDLCARINRIEEFVSETKRIRRTLVAFLMANLILLASGIAGGAVFAYRISDHINNATIHVPLKAATP